jgi:hypothetical protein
LIRWRKVRLQLAEHVAALCARQSDPTPPAQSLLLLRFFNSPMMTQNPKP